MKGSFNLEVLSFSPDVIHSKLILDLNIEGLRNLKVLDLSCVLLNEAAFMKFLVRTTKLEDLRVNGCSTFGDGFFF
jgi:hypothetical protein